MCENKILTFQSFSLKISICICICVHYTTIQKIGVGKIFEYFW